MEFGRFAAENRAIRGKGKPETFNFLGFTHISGKDHRQVHADTKDPPGSDDGNSESHQRRSAKALALLNPRTGKMAQESGSGIPELSLGTGQLPTMQKFRTHVTNLWRRALRRRSQKDDTTWTKANKLAAAWLPRVRVLHPWPVERFTARHPRQEPGA
jgi:hypothetical protein